MKKLLVGFCFILISGCVSQAELDARNIEDINVSGKDPICVRQSLAVYSACASSASQSMGGAGAVISGLAACKSSYKVAVSTCALIE